MYCLQCNKKYTKPLGNVRHLNDLNNNQTNLELELKKLEFFNISGN